MLIGELAKAVGVSKDTIRHYDDMKLLVVNERQAGSRVYRDFPEDNISRIAMIRAGKDLGVTLSEMQKMIHLYDAGEMTDEQVVQLLQERLKIVQDKIKSLKHTEKLLKNKLENYP